MLGDLFAALRTSQSGLIANQRALSTVAQNIANVNTPGYSRKDPTLEQRVVDGSGAGGDLTQLKRTVDEALQLVRASVHAPPPLSMDIILPPSHKSR